MRVFLRRMLPLMTLVAPLATLSAQGIEVDAPAVILTGIPFNVTVRAPTSLDSVPLVLRTATGVELQAGTIPPVGEIVLRHVVVDEAGQLPLRLEAGGTVEEIARPLVPGWTSLLPPLVAIVLALVFHEVVSSLFVGLWLGAFIVTGYNPFKAILVAIDGFVQPALANADHAAIVVFSLMLGGMVGVMARMGGTWAIVEAVTPLATSRRRGLLATWAAGVAIFFDDYANTLIVGNTMRPLTDRLRISREKLAYIVDSTAAPVTVIVFVSTWVGFEIGLIGDSLQLAAEQSVAHPELATALAAMSPFSVFISTVPYLFYPIMAIIAVALFGWTGRDFGPMLAAERRAASGKGLYAPGAQLAADPTTQLEGPPAGTPLRWWNGAMPVLVVVVAVVLGLYFSGKAALAEGQPGTLTNILGSADPFKSLLWGAMLGVLTAVFLAVGQRILTLTQAIDAWVAGLRAMLLAMVILVLAWSLGEVTQAVGTAPFLTSVLSDRMPVTLLPVTVFLVAALISFSTGTSWATMAILFPLVVPLAVALGDPTDIISGTGSIVLHGAISSVMAGSIFGDHCSPISDTTVLSSTASGCDHVDHVRTQLPYAIVVALITMTVGDLGTSLGLSPWIALLMATAVLWAVIRFIGQPVEVA